MIKLAWKKITRHFVMGKLRSWLTYFVFQGHYYRYLCHHYNATWRNERAVEVPIIWREVKAHTGKRVLELGNVLSHYFSISHDVLDKYEVGTGVINADIVSFSPKTKYDLIVGISTLEHVGWDETPRDARKTVQAVQSMKKMLRAGGTLLLTFPLGYNPHLDTYLKKNSYGFDELYFLEKISESNTWRQIPKLLNNVRYGHPYENAHVIGVGKVHSGIL